MATSCFSDLSGYKFQTQSGMLKDKDDWYTFNRIESYNIYVSTQRSERGTSNVGYYQYISDAEKAKYQSGLSLHVKYLGPITVVQKN